MCPSQSQITPQLPIQPRTQSIGSSHYSLVEEPQPAPELNQDHCVGRTQCHSSEGGKHFWAPQILRGIEAMHFKPALVCADTVMKYYLKQVFKQQVQQSLSGAEVVCIFGQKGGRFKRSLARGGCSTDGQAVSGRSKRREQSCCPLRAQCSCPPIADSN